MIAAMAFGHLAWAQESSNNLKIEDLKNDPHQVQGEDVDEVITNKLLRAESGSKSKWSLASNLNYNGGSIEKPFSEDRPNVAEATGIIPKTNIQGQASVKYGLDSRNSLLLGVGLRWIAPLSAGQLHDYEGSRFDADNPYLTYQYVYRFFGVQAVMQVQALAFTNANLLNEGYVGQLEWDQENMYELGASGLSIGASTWVALQSFNKTGPVGDLEDVRTDQSDVSFGVEPCLEYAINDRVNLRSVTSLWVFEHTRATPSANTYFKDKVYESLGVGISVTRDVYLFPNVQFLPDDLRADRTNVALNTNINLF